MDAEATISVKVSADLAEYYNKSSDNSRENMNKIIAAELRRQRAKELMEGFDEIAQAARARGLTPEILEEILNSEDDE